MKNYRLGYKINIAKKLVNTIEPILYNLPILLSWLLYDAGIQYPISRITEYILSMKISHGFLQSNPLLQKSSAKHT